MIRFLGYYAPTLSTLLVPASVIPFSDGSDKDPWAEHGVIVRMMRSDKATLLAFATPRQLCFAKGCFGGGIVSTSVDKGGNTDEKHRPSPTVFECQ